MFLYVFYIRYCCIIVLLYYYISILFQLMNILLQFKKHWKILFLIFLVILCVITTYLLSKSKNSFANKQYTYGIYIYVHEQQDKLSSIMTYIQLLANKPSMKNKIENTFIYLLDNNSHNDENSITTAIEGYNIKITEQYIDMKKERIKTKLNTRDCLIKGYTYLYPKCKYVMHIDVDNFDINDMYELTDISSINNFYIDGQDYTKVHCTSDYSSGYFSNEVYNDVTDVLSLCPLEISGDLVRDKLDKAGIRVN